MPGLIRVFILLDTAHVFAPILLSWAHPGFRRGSRNDPWPYLIAPLAVCGGGVAVASTTGFGWPLWMVNGYLFWNFWHFSSQNYGVLRLAGVTNVRASKMVAFVGTAAGMYYMPLVMGVHHWLTDIALSTRVMRRHHWWAFLGALVMLSPLGFAWSVVDKQMTPDLQILMGIRFSIGIYHFMVSGRIWKCPEVRSEITNVRGSHLRLRGLLGPVRDVPRS